jgi:acetoin utilization deacetylase AcuC-like enzyme
MQPSGEVPIVWCPRYEVDIGDHVFPVEKYRLIKERLDAAGTLDNVDLQTPQPATEEDVLRVHTEAYWTKIREGAFTPQEERLLELPFSPELRDASLLCAGGTSQTCRLALSRGRSVHLGGGFHHAFADHGEGFCLLNDVAIAAATLLAEAAVDRVALVDLDVHHGNGTASIFADDPRVFTFSVHHQWNYPAIKPRGDLDVGLEDGFEDEEYMEVLREHLPNVLDEHKPELVIYLAGADPYEADQLGGLGLSIQGLRRRDEFVLRNAADRGIGLAITLAGGYAIRPTDTVAIHCGTVEAALA